MRRFSNKSVATPTLGQQPTCDDVVDIVLVGALCDLTVGVLCLTPEMLECWTRRLDQFGSPIATVEVLDTNCITLEEWKSKLNPRHFDVIVLSGVQAELQAHQLSAGYVKALVDAAPSGMVIVT